MTITEKTVRKYLENHCNFFSKNIDLLNHIKIPVETGDAISLVEYQLLNLKKRVQALEYENDLMIETARVNSGLFDRTRKLILGMLEAQDLDDLSIVLDKKLAASFNIPIVRLLLLDEEFKEQPSSSVIQPIKPELFEESNGLDNFLKSGYCLVGRLNKKLRQCIFKENSELVKSSATLALVRGKSLGLLALGHTDQAYFQASMDTMFLDHIAEALSIIIPKLIKKEQN